MFLVPTFFGLCRLALLVTRASTRVIAHAEQQALPRATPATSVTTEPEHEPDCSAFVLTIPGGGVVDAEPAPWTKARLDAAADYFNRTCKNGDTTSSTEEQGVEATSKVVRRNQKCFFAPLSAGTPHLPMPIDPTTGKTLTESGAAAKYLVKKHNVSPDRILEEGASLDTIGNAYFLRVIHLEMLLKTHKLVTVVVFTSEFHMPRTKAIFEHVLKLPWTSSSIPAGAMTTAGVETVAARTCAEDEDASKDGDSSHQGTTDHNGISLEENKNTNKKCLVAADGTSAPPAVSTGSTSTSCVVNNPDSNLPSFQTEFVATENRGLTEDQAKLRKEREVQSLETWRSRTQPKLNSVVDLHSFVFQDHGAYAAKRFAVEEHIGAPVDLDEVRRTYR
ncbi:unnamed protein product [Amoebophrya sp. A120]|nr:unnamed protein product [Amoebophrya sp. A120]|eukprot:GSA120T00011594001.1